MNATVLIGCVVGIIGCVIGVATYISALLTKSKQDGMLVAKIDQCVKGIDDIKRDMKEKNHELDATIDEHSKAITKMQTEIKTIFKQLNMERE